MANEILLAIIQAVTEFLPVSSSGHLALVSNFLGELNLFLITILHLASLFSVLIFTRKEIVHLLTFNKSARKLWLYLIIATIPAVIFALIFRQFIETAFSSYIALGIAFLFTGFVVLSTKFAARKSKLNPKNSLIIGLFQMLALFPGVSRSGMTISSSLLSGIDKEKAAKFSFLLFIPLSIGAVILEFGNAYLSLNLAIAFVLCFLLSLLFLNLILIIIKKGYFWLFSIYCFIIGMIALILHFH